MLRAPADVARAAKLFALTLPPWAVTCAVWIRIAAAGVIGVLEKAPVEPWGDEFVPCIVFGIFCRAELPDDLNPTPIPP